MKRITRYKPALSKFEGLHATRSRGLSLIELLVAIGIVVLILAVGIPAFSKFGRQNELDQAAELVKNALLETQSLALGPPTDKLQDVTLYYFFVESDLRKFGIKQGKLGSDGKIQQIDSIFKYFNLPTGISFLETSYQVAYSTTAGSRVVGNSSSEIKITNPKLERTKTRKIEINSLSGQISISKE